MSLLVGIAILALAVAVGGIAALFREHGERAMPAIRSFAIVAAASIALLHLLPEAFAEIRWLALLAAAAGLFGPALLERLLHEGHTHEAPTTALAMGYAAVIAHQAGEGAAVTSLARTGALKPSIILAIAAHTVPLAMVVTVRVLEVRPGPGRKRAASLALAGVALATVAGALAGNLVGAAVLASIQPWVLATVAGLLLHALSHDTHGEPNRTLRARLVEGGAGLLGLGVATLGVEQDGWIRDVPSALRAAGIAVVALAVIARSTIRRTRASATSRS